MEEVHHLSAIFEKVTLNPIKNELTLELKKANSDKGQRLVFRGRHAFIVMILRQKPVSGWRFSEPVMKTVRAVVIRDYPRFYGPQKVRRGGKFPNDGALRISYLRKAPRITRNPPDFRELPQPERERRHEARHSHAQKKFHLSPRIYRTYGFRPQFFCVSGCRMTFGARRDSLHRKNEKARRLYGILPWRNGEHCTPRSPAILLSVHVSRRRRLSQKDPKNHSGRSHFLS